MGKIRVFNGEMRGKGCLMSGAAARTGSYKQIDKIKFLGDSKKGDSFKRREVVLVAYKYI